MLGNKLFKSFLDKSMNYTCAYWKDAKNLEEAQQHKIKLIGRKLKLKPDMRVLDMGCGWGGLCKYLAETYKVEVVGVTISKEGAKVGQERCKGLPVEIRVQVYRDVNERFDRIVIVGLIEHVGRKNYRSFFELANRCLSDNGILLLHTIGHDNDKTPPSEHFLNIGPHYDKTLMAWHDNFVKNWHNISHLYENPKVFYRMWTYYLLMCAGLFRARRAQLWQIVMTKGLPGGYSSVR